MSVLIVIPARYASTRYPGKPLVSLRGATGQSLSLIERSWRAARAVKGVDRIVVATDDSRIQSAAVAFGAEVVMTSEGCSNGTERCAEARAFLGGGFEIVVNLQGDAPLTPPWTTVAVATPRPIRFCRRRFPWTPTLSPKSCTARTRAGSAWATR